MGMFDSISVAEALPSTQEMKDLGLDANKYSFQTKSLDCTMSSYIIQNNKLFVQKYKDEKWVPGNEKAKNFMDRLGHMERENPYYEEVYFHGEIYFYEFINNVKDTWDCWVEYKATFTQGTLTSVELFKFEKTDNQERKQKEQDWIKILEYERSIWYNKYIFNTKAYRWFSRMWYKGCTAIARFFNWLAFKL